METVLKILLLRAVTILAALAACLGSSAAHAEDGYDLWLRYPPLSSTAQTRYLGNALAIVSGAETPTLAAARSEFVRAMDEPLLEAGDALSFRRGDVPARTLQRLGRGEFAAQDELDLHLAGVREAETLLRAFIADARAAGHGCVRVIHGKGLHSTDDFGRGGVPVLKNLVDRLLRQRADVLAYHSAPPRAGGTGAVLVLLAPPRRR